ncbi:MAG: M48 family metallopeptidase, partial [Planctomycetales bacterium]|nr:M48 family metallopeptidase [Planctomycetales bacterium]
MRGNVCLTMISRIQRRKAAFRHFTLIAGLMAAASSLTSVCHADITPAQQELVDLVMGRLLVRIDRPEKYAAWPPEWKIIDDDDLNAFATIDYEKSDQELIPLVRVHRGLLEVVAEMDPDRLAFILGHEIAHLTHGHVLDSPRTGEAARLMFDREEELEADLTGMEYALQAGFSYKKGIEAAQRIREKGSGYTSFEGLSTDHPSWAERIALMEQDETQQKLWHATSAFETGVFFLQAEQFQSAEIFFERVTREFPKCHEAWVNLGYAQLMRYCDGLEPEDLRTFGIGQLVVGGFYQRAEGLFRGPDEQLWWDAVGSLQRALTLRDDLILAKANLALAYLVHPSGSPDVGKAAEFYEQVAALLDDPAASKTVDPLTRAALWANAWVGFEHNDPQRSEQVIADIEAALKQAEQLRTGRTAAERVRAALNFTRANALAAEPNEESRRRSLRLFEDYLQATPASSSWWPLAHERYMQIADDLGARPKTEKELSKKKQSAWRAVTAVAVEGAAPVVLADPP